VEEMKIWIRKSIGWERECVKERINKTKEPSKEEEFDDYLKDKPEKKNIVDAFFMKERS
jgi:hypothetical protein